MSYPYSASDVGTVNGKELSQPEKEAVATEWNANYEAEQAVYYKFLRRKEYASVVSKKEGLQEQLDLIWHDIDAGKFGEGAKTGEWFKAIKKVKDDNPKS